MPLDEHDLLRMLSTAVSDNEIAKAIVSELHQLILTKEHKEYHGRPDNQTLKVGDLERADVVHDGEKMTASQWAQLYELKPKHVVHRVNTLGWSLSEACTTPLRGKPR